MAVNEGVGRTRYFDNRKPGEHWYVDHYPKSCANRIWERTTDNASGDIGSHGYMYDLVVKHFARRKAAGEMFFNTMTKYSTAQYTYGSASIDMVTTALACTAPNTNGLYKVSGAFLSANLNWPAPGASVTDTELNRLITLATTECQAKRGEGLTNLIESFAELDQVWHLVRNPLEQIDKFARDFRRHGKKRRRPKNVGSFIDQSKDIYDFGRKEWLIWRYGVSPLMKDVAAAMKSMQKGHPKDAIRVAARGKARINRITSTASQFNWANIILVDYLKTNQSDFDVRAVWYDEWQPTVFSDLGFSVKNVLVVGWELTRLSFMLDWFGNVGDYLYANAPMTDSSPIGGSYTISRTNRVVCSPTNVSRADVVNWSSVSGTCDSCEVVQKFITRIVGIPAPGITIRPDFRFDNYIRCLDLVALIPSVISTFNFGPRN